VNSEERRREIEKKEEKTRRTHADTCSEKKGRVCEMGEAARCKECVRERGCMRQPRSEWARFVVERARPFIVAAA